LPHEVGFPAKHNWTLALAAAYVEREIERGYTFVGMAKLLHRFVQERFPQLKK